jgi:4,5-DOPA dioxygenase extradiol
MLPALFISHGAPDLPLHESPTRTFLQSLGQTLGKPSAILVISPHWMTAVPTLSTDEQMHAIYDFGGFPAELYRMTYNPPGAPGLFDSVSQQLATLRLKTAVHPSRGLDHGAWTPLILMYPDSEIPVTQLSLQPHLNPRQQWELGKALAPLRQQNVLILTSGSATHNLWRMGDKSGNEPPVWVSAFDHWIANAVEQQATTQLLNYRTLAPYAEENHPSEEHIMPLFIAMGAGTRGKQIHAGYTYGVLSMAAYAFE